MQKVSLFYKTGVLACGILVLYSVTQIIRWLINRRTINKIPGPYSQFIVGNLFDILGSLEYHFKWLRMYASKYKIYRMWIGPVSTVNIFQPEDIEILISTTENLTKSHVYVPLLPWLGTGLLTSTGEKWHGRRKLLTPAFHFSILEQFVHIFHQQTDKLVQKWEAHVGKPYVNITPHISELTLHSINETAMGTRLDKSDKKQAAYKSSLNEFSKLAVFRLIKPWLFIQFIWVLSSGYWRQRKLLKTMHDFTISVIKERKGTLLSNPIQKTGAVSVSKRRLAMLDLLLSAQNDGFKIDEQGIREEVDTFTFEGHDTVAMSICFTLQLLACHKNIQEKVFKEIEEVYGDANKPSIQTLQNLRYLEMCIKESLRLYPSVPLISRLASKDILLSQGYKVPKNNQVHIHIYDLHHNPDLYPDPERFEPDRFLPENTVNRHPFAYLPFSGGPRNCIGQKFAMLEMKTVIAGILRKYQLICVDTQDDIVLQQELVLRPKYGIKIKIVGRL